MVTALLDTNVVIDLLRKHLVAENWLTMQRDLGVSRIVWLEVLEGVSDKRDQQRAITLLKDFELISTTNEDVEWAARQMMRLGLRDGMDAFDCLIAAPAQRLKLPLYTRNLKHMTPLLGLGAVQPY